MNIPYYEAVTVTVLYILQFYSSYSFVYIFVYTGQLLVWFMEKKLQFSSLYREDYERASHTYIYKTWKCERNAVYIHVIYHCAFCVIFISSTRLYRHSLPSHTPTQTHTFIHCRFFCVPSEMNADDHLPPAFPLFFSSLAPCRSA